MGRRRQNLPADLPDRIPGAELAQWMRVNDISSNLLAKELGVKFSTVQGWLRGYRPTPAWLERRIKYIAMGSTGHKLPFYGKRWEAGVTSADMVAWRAANHLSQGTAAHCLGVSQRTYSRYEKGEAPIPEAVVMMMQARPARGAPPSIDGLLQGAPPPLGDDPDRLPAEDEGFVDERGQVVWYEEDED